MSENQSITVEKDNIAYSINNQESTASVRYCNIKCIDFIIPRSIIYNSKEYIVTSILEKAFFGSLAKSIRFASNSEIRTIERNSLNFKLESITIPSKLVDLQEGWCSTAPNLTRVNVSPQNPRYRSIDNKFIIGKKIIEQTNFDCFVFCSRDVKGITIPSCIKHISPFSFSDCKNLQKVEFASDSKLQTIENSAFSSSSIEAITIPSEVNRIGKSAFFN